MKVEVFKDGLFIDGHEILNSSIKLIGCPVNSRQYCDITIFPDEIVIKNENKSIREQE